MNSTFHAHLSTLETILREQDRHHAQLLQLLERKRDAIRRADGPALVQLFGPENDLVGRIRDGEEARQAVLRELAGASGARTADCDQDTAHPATKSGQPSHASKSRSIRFRDGDVPWHELVEKSPDPGQKDRLLALGAQVRDKAERVLRLSAVLRAAAEALSNHIAGIMESVHASLNSAAVYGRRGRLSERARIRSTVDLTT